MSEKDGSMLGAIAQIIDKFVTSYGIWLWLTIFGIIVLILDRQAFISINSASTSPKDLATIGLVLTLCLFLNAIRFELLLLEIVGNLISEVVDRIASKKKARSTLRKILKADCQERDWIIWYTFYYCSEHSGGYHTRVSERRDGYTRYSDGIATTLAFDKLLRELDCGDTVYLNPRVDFFTEIEALASTDPDFRAEIRGVRDRVAGKTLRESDLISQPSLILKSSKKSFYMINKQAKKRELDNF